ncbi:MAG: nicotinamide-nucleotide amidase [Gammaproteobacteria bacterium]
MAELEQLAVDVGGRLKTAGLTAVVAESCTGGWVAKVLTDVPGSSVWFERGFVTYSNAAKIELLAVSPQTLDEHGAVSEATVREMAEGALRNSEGDIAVSISGVAGPDGGSRDKPVGTVWFAWARSGSETRSRHECFTGDRDAVRRAAVVVALQGIAEFAGA